MQYLTTLLVMAATCMPGMYADSPPTTDVGATAGSGPAPPGMMPVPGGFIPAPPGTPPVPGAPSGTVPAPPGMVSAPGGFIPAPSDTPPAPEPPSMPPPPAPPVDKEEPVDAQAPSPAPGADLDLDDPEVFAAFLEDYSAAEGPEGAVTGALTGALPQDTDPAAPSPLSACGGPNELCCALDGIELTCNDRGYACDVFSIGTTSPTCVKCGGLGDMCCHGEDLQFSCVGEGLVCDFSADGITPTCEAGEAFAPAGVIMSPAGSRRHRRPREESPRPPRRARHSRVEA